MKIRVTPGLFRRGIPGAPPWRGSSRTRPFRPASGERSNFLRDMSVVEVVPFMYSFSYMFSACPV